MCTTCTKPRALQIACKCQASVMAATFSHVQSFTIWFVDLHRCILKGTNFTLLCPRRKSWLVRTAIRVCPTDVTGRKTVSISAFTIPAIALYGDTCCHILQATPCGPLSQTKFGNTTQPEPGASKVQMQRRAKLLISIKPVSWLF
jgi:hypothetical protein